jgi:hypothetical protein
MHLLSFFYKIYKKKNKNMKTINQLNKKNSSSSNVTDSLITGTPNLSDLNNFKANIIFNTLHDSNKDLLVNKIEEKWLNHTLFKKANLDNSNVTYVFNLLETNQSLKILQTTPINNNITDNLKKYITFDSDKKDLTIHLKDINLENAYERITDFFSNNLDPINTFLIGVSSAVGIGSIYKAVITINDISYNYVLVSAENIKINPAEKAKLIQSINKSKLIMNGIGSVMIITTLYAAIQFLKYKNNPITQFTNNVNDSIVKSMNIEIEKITNVNTINDVKDSSVLLPFLKKITSTKIFWLALSLFISLSLIFLFPSGLFSNGKIFKLLVLLAIGIVIIYYLIYALTLLKFSSRKPEEIKIPNFYPLNKILSNIKEIGVNKNINYLILEVYIRTTIYLFIFFFITVLVLIIF